MSLKSPPQMRYMFLEVGFVHPNEQVVLLVVAFAELTGGVSVAGNAVLRQLSPGRRVDRIADLLRLVAAVAI